jgi:simple sugar transport system substrate-binding protein
MKKSTNLFFNRIRAIAIVVVFTALACFMQPAIAADKQYRFVMISHIGSYDPNMKWLTLSLEEFEKRYPDVDTEYNYAYQYSLQKDVQYSVQEHVRLIERIVATNPDGIAVPIVSSDAMEGPLRNAIERGIPVVAFNIPDTRPEGERIPYLTYVGGDEYLTGKRLGEFAIQQANDGKIPKPRKVMCANHDAVHQGLKTRYRGMKDAMETIGVEVEELFIGADPAKARNTMKSYLSANKDVNYIFTVASWSSPWAWGVANDMGLDPDVDNKGMTILTVDASPIALGGIKRGHILACNSQGFWLQGYIPMEWLYWYHELGYKPQSDIITGPVIVSADNIDHWEKFVRKIFGKAFDEQDTW